VKTPGFADPEDGARTLERKTQRRKQRAFASRFEAEVVRLGKGGDRSLTEVATDLGLAEAALLS
jgi:hypothetical protein